MITPAYIGSQFRAVINMAQDNDLWRERLDADADGFYRSFWALAFEVPLAFVLSWMGIVMLSQIDQVSTNVMLELPLMPLLVMQTIGTMAGRVATLVLLVIVVRGLKAERSVSPMIVGYNWSELLLQSMMTLTMAVILIVAPAGLFMLVLGVLIFGLYLRWGIIRRALRVNAIQTVAIIAMLGIGSYFIGTVVYGLGASLIGFMIDFEPVAAADYFGTR